MKYLMTEDMLNIEEIKMHNKTISKILVAIIMTSMLIAIIPTLPVSATTLTGITPVSGNVGTVVRVVGTIDTLGGSYSIYFDTNDDSDAYNDGGAIKSGNAPANSYAVNDTFTVPPCLGSDAGNGHLVVLRDESTLGVQSTSFQVITKRTVTTAAHDQEGNTTAVTVTVTGGTVANTVNNYTVGITNPAGTMYVDGNFSFISDGVGSGSVTKSFPSATFTTGASTNFTGTYSVQTNRTQPGIITNAASTSFTIGLTDKLSYGRFEPINVKTSGWTPGQNVTITIKDPADQTVRQWANAPATDGTVSGTYIIPWNATMGIYTIEAVNATGNDKAIASMHTFEVGSAALTVIITAQPAAAYQRTNTVSASFTIQYPDDTFYTNTTQFSSITVTVKANSTTVATIPLTAANYAANTWTVSWKIPRNATLGSGYTLTLTKDSILDTNGNHGPTASSGVSTTAFTVNPATLAVMLTMQPAANYTRTVAAMAKMNITYPDNTFFTAADLGTVTVSVEQGATSIANFTLAASAFNSTTNQWTISWVSGFNSTLANDYLLWIRANNVKDASSNVGPTAPVIANAFELLRVVPTITAISTNEATYSRGEFVQIFFDATYADGSAVTTGTASINVVAPDGFSTTTLAPVHTSNGRWAVTWWASEATQVGSYNVTLNANALMDGATPSNNGPATVKTTSFTMLPSEVTLEDIMDAIDALDDRLNSVEGDTSSLGSQISTLYTAVNGLGDIIDDLQTQLDSLGATSATTTEVAAVSSAVSSLSTNLGSLESKLSALQTAVGNAATDSDVAAVNAAIAEVNAEIAALETNLNNLNTAIDAAATPADVDAAVDSAVSDLSDTIGGVNTLVIVAVVLSLIAAAAAIAAVYIIQRKIAG